MPPLPAWWPDPGINAGMIVDVQPQQSHDIQGLWQDVVNDGETFSMFILSALAFTPHRPLHGPVPL